MRFPRCVAFLACLCLAPFSLAQQNNDSPVIRPMLSQKIAAMEDEIAHLSQSQLDAPREAKPAMDLRIDLRICARAMLLISRDARPESMAQVNAYLKGRQLLIVIPQVDAALADAQQPPETHERNDALAQLHQLSFQFSKAADPKKPLATDDLCRAIASDLTPILALSRAPVLMRPKVETSRPENADSRRSPDEVVALVRQMTVSMPLRKQLNALAVQARDSADEKEVDFLRKTLGDAFELAVALQNRTAVSEQSRQQLDARLTDALTLVSDVRTRGAGVDRLAAMSEYRRIASRIDKMHLDDELSHALAPAFIAANESDRGGDKILSAIEAFLSVNAHFSEPRNLSMPDSLRRGMDEIDKQYQHARAQFLSDATSAPQQLPAQINELRRLNDLSDALLSLPRTLDTLAAYKPRPTGGLEKRVNQQVVLAIGTAGNRDDAAKFLRDLNALATVADAMSKASVTDVPAATMGKYAPSFADFDAKWRAMVADMATAAAAGQPIDAARLDRLQNAPALVDALHDAANVDQSLAAVPSLVHWVDWTITPQQCDDALKDYRDALRGAFTAFVADSNRGAREFDRVRHRDEPLLKLLSQSAAKADDCARLPTGLNGDVAKLATPLDGAPFAAQRMASVMLEIWSIAPQDKRDTIMDAARRHVADELK